MCNSPLQESVSCRPIDCSTFLVATNRRLSRHVRFTSTACALFAAAKLRLTGNCAEAKTSTGWMHRAATHRYLSPIWIGLRRCDACMFVAAMERWCQALRHSSKSGSNCCVRLAGADLRQGGSAMRPLMADRFRRLKTAGWSMGCEFYPDETPAPPGGRLSMACGSRT